MRRIAIIAAASIAAGVFVAPGTVGAAPPANLSVSVVADPVGSIEASRSFTADYTVVNSGGPAGASVSELYLSTNRSLDASDVFLRVDEVPAIAAGASASRTPVVVVPVPTPPGRYFLIACANHAPPAIPESTLADNCNTSATRVRVKAADPGRLSGLTSYAFGEGCPFVHQLFHGDISSTGPYGASTFAFDGCVGSSSSFPYSGTFVMQTPLGEVTGVVSGKLGSTLPGSAFKLTMAPDGSADRIEIKGIWHSTGGFTTQEMPIEGSLTYLVAG